jgi:HlyD family secretion protein
MRLQLRRVAYVAVLSSLVVAACTKLPEDYPTPTPLPTPSVSNKPIYTVQRGTIDQVVKSLGRIAANEEAILYFRQGGRLFHLSVDTDQKVKKGDLLAELDSGTLKDQVQVAQVQADIADLKIDQTLGKNIPGQEPASVTTARSAVTKAEADYAKAQDALDSVMVGGSTASDLAAARAGVTAAQAAVTAAQAAVRAAEAQVTSAQQALADTMALPRPEDVQAAQSAVEQAKNSLYAVQLSRDSTCGSAGAQSGTCKSGDANVAAQQTAVNAAQAKLDLAKRPATAVQVASAKQAVSTAQSGLSGAQSGLSGAQSGVAAAQAKVAALQQGPTAANIDSAKQGVASAQAALDQARTNLDQANGSIAGTSIDVQIARKNADLAKLQLAQLQTQLDEAQLRAPFDGVVTETDAKDGDLIQAYTPILTVSNPTKLEIAVELQAADLTNVALGQPTTIVLSAFPTTQLSGKIIRMPSIATGNSPQLPATLRTVRISFPNPPGVVNLGDLANVAIDVQRKEGVLVLPTTALRTFGGRRFVRVQTPDGRDREVDVQIGINDDTNTEITQGLQAGDKVISP